MLASLLWPPQHPAWMTQSASVQASCSLSLEFLRDSTLEQSLSSCHQFQRPSVPPSSVDFSALPIHSVLQMPGIHQGCKEQGYWVKVNIHGFVTGLGLGLGDTTTTWN